MGRHTLVGATAEAITVSIDGAFVGYVKALPGNADTIYVEDDADIDSTTGFPLAAGETLPIPLDTLDGWYARGTSGDAIAVVAALTE